ncbi:MAG: nucleotide exchange factor GrpE [Planctomycetes bacterium]|nr:nucleotide exchange factor GrpE [Planctomycetota bacterium]MBT4028642.1 nucleotide exchange factor GrpE [Planctomycetota bacterium]MBT4559534.1 nucleotide exchange factor GrpE [Planctomycetota bacterium]MBT5101553.1 nucleotide exchange factor GrpE [Planctomycetota bacterium]MBT7011898.1 nucleotide exchange factor GrpE [Planctomycetota bacterium]
MARKKKKKEKLEEGKADAQTTVEADSQASEADTSEPKAKVEPKPEPVQDLDYWKDKALRSQADNQNMRRRLQEDVEMRTRLRLEGLLTELIMVADFLDSAVDHVPEEIRKADENGGFHMGLEAIRTALASTMRNHGLVVIQPSAQDKFDPELHEALETVERDELEKDELELVRKGFRLGKRIMRAAQVRLLRAPATAEE